MNEKPSTDDWASARGEKWLTQLAGMEATLKPVDEPLIRALHLDAPYRVADIGCGGGGTTLEILHAAPAGSTVHGFDLSPALIEFARSRTPAIAFSVANMQTTAPPEGPYDRLVSRFGTMFFPDPPVAFANIARWLAPRGRFAFAVWGPLAENLWMATVQDVVAEIIELPAPDPAAPGPFRYSNAVTLLDLLKQAGYSELRVSDWRGALPVGGGLSAPEAARFALTAFSNFGELLANAGGDAPGRAEKALTARLHAHEKNGVVRMDACVHIVTGTRASFQ